MSITWIPVNKRVPDNRRLVLAWGWCSLWSPSKFIGVTKFNASATNGYFDCERGSLFSVSKVTHWAEIDGPVEREPLPPPKQPGALAASRRENV